MSPRQTSFLFDLDGTLVDSVYQHVLAWHEALQAEGIELSVWRIHRKIGMCGGLFTNMLLRETGGAIDAAIASSGCAAVTRRPTGQRADQVRPLPGRAGSARRADRGRDSLGDRDQRADGDRRARPREARRRSGRGAGRDARQGAARQARSRPVPRRRRGARRADRVRLRGRRQRLGHARRPARRRPRASACCRAATARTSW